MRPLKIFLKRPLVVSAIAAITLVLAACGGTADPTTSSSSPSQSQNNAAATPAQTADRVAPTEAANPEATVTSPTASVSSNTQQNTQDADPIPTPAAVSALTSDSKEPAETKEPANAAAPANSAIAATGQVGGAVGDLAPEFLGISNWINSQPLVMEELKGNVVLIDFWTYTCVNCIRTFPYLKEWNDKYKDSGLVIVGVHTPEFEFEKVTENVVLSARDYNLDWPIAQDNDFGTWSAYSNRFWPAKYLVDAEGVVRYTHFGEGAYVETEEQIRALLEESGKSLQEIEISTAEEPEADSRAFSADPTTRITREIYGGFRRNSAPQGVYVAHVEYYEAPSQTLDYIDPGDHQNQFMYLQGLWTNGDEKLKHARETQDFSDYIASNFFATSVNAVINPEGGPPFDVQVTIDGRPLTTEEAGADMIIEGGRSFFIVDEPRLYEVVALPEFGDHELKLSANSPDFAFFAFTFGAYRTGP